MKLIQRHQKSSHIIIAAVGASHEKPILVFLLEISWQLSRLPKLPETPASKSPASIYTLLHANLSGRSRSCDLQLLYPSSHSHMRGTHMWCPDFKWVLPRVRGTMFDSQLLQFTGASESPAFLLPVSDLSVTSSAEN